MRLSRICLCCCFIAALAHLAGGAFTPENFRDTFPSCVELVGLRPPPHSVVRHRNYHTDFEMTFSRPVKRSRKYKAVSLSSSPRGYIRLDDGYSDSQGIVPEVVPALWLDIIRSGFSVWKARFNFRDEKTGGPKFR